MNKKDDKFIWFLYKTVIGRCFLKVFTSKTFSFVSGLFLNSFLSKPMIKKYIKKYSINMNEYENERYKSFNSFFIRKRKEIKFSKENNTLISPCDGFLTVYNIGKECVLNIKNNEYTVGDLLKDSKTAELFDDGLCLVFRLAPHNFHRYSFIDCGKVIFSKTISGVLHCVRPIPCEQFPVFAQNKRELTLIETENFGSVIQMEVGAMIVGKINNCNNKINIKKCEEKGYFEFGGSTIIVLLKKDKAEINEKILNNSKNDIETPVLIGETIGVKK